MGRLPVITLLLFVSLSLSGIPEGKDTALIFFPGSRIFPVIFPDPLECQIQGGSYLISRDESRLSLYSVVNLGFNRPVLAGHVRMADWEINFGAATFTQFDLIRKEDGSYLAGLLNNDYKISSDLSIRRNPWLLRFRLFHVSSHQGDDYMLRHNDTLPNNKSVNYEQADLTLLRLLNKGYWYIGCGEIYTKYVFRERLSFQGGGLINFAHRGAIDYFTAANIKIFAENNYIPDIRSVIGISIKRKNDPLMRFWAEYYNGFLPYSTLPYGRVSWTGLAMTLNLF